MNFLEQYNQIFTKTFGVEEKELDANFTSMAIGTWDSVTQMNLIASLEDAFDIMMDTEDILDFDSYEKGREILKRYEVEVL